MIPRRTQRRCEAAHEADAMRLLGRWLAAERLYRRAAESADGMARRHLNLLAQHCSDRRNRARTT